jgi:uncharacterized glyoxalase superfamily protein PhnB
MTEAAHPAEGRSSPGLRYRDVGAAIDWLCRAFGFEVRSVETDEKGAVIYAELSFGSTIIMLGAVQGFDIDRYMRQPDDIGGAETQCCYYVVGDLDAHYDRARAAGCKIVIDRTTRANGTRAYTCRDPEGHLWCFGTYDPWHTQTARTERPAPVIEVGAPAASHVALSQRHSLRFPARLAAGLSMGAIVSGIAVAWVYGEAWQTSREAAAAPSSSLGPEHVVGAQFANAEFERAIRDARLRLAFERSTRRAAERASKAAQQETAHERALRIAAEQAAKQLADKLALAQQAADAAKSAATTAQNNLAKMRTGKSDDDGRFAREIAQAKRAADDARAELARAQAARVAAEQEAKRAADEARAQVARAQAATAAAEKEAKDVRARLTFVSLNSKEGSAQAITEIRDQVATEKAARQAAERDASSAREELARERSLKQAAWRTVELLKRRLASAGSAQFSADDGLVQKPTPARRRTAAVARPTPVVEKALPNQTAAGWSLYSGPNFFKDH